MNPDWLYALACYRARLADRRALLEPSWTWFSSATDVESEQLLQLIDLAEDKAARQVDIESTIERLLNTRGLDAPDAEDAHWIVVFGLTTGVIHLEPYSMAHFLGWLPSDPDFDLISCFLVTIDDHDDGVIDAAQAELEIANDFTSARPPLAAVALERLGTKLQTRWVLDTLQDGNDPRGATA